MRTVVSLDVKVNVVTTVVSSDDEGPPELYATAETALSLEMVGVESRTVENVSSDMLCVEDDTVVVVVV